MNTNQTRDLAVKVFGLYCFTVSIILLPQIISAFGMMGKETELIQSRLIYVAAIGSPFILYMVFGWYFIFRTHRVISLIWQDSEASTEGATSAHNSLAFWIVLIGIYFFIDSVSGLAAELWILGTKRAVWGSFLSLKLLPNVITCPLSLVCIFRAKQIEDFIQKRQK